MVFVTSVFNLNENLHNLTDEDRAKLKGPAFEKSKNFDELSGIANRLAIKYVKSAPAVFDSVEDLVNDIYLFMINVILYDEEDYKIDKDEEKRSEWYNTTNSAYKYGGNIPTSKRLGRSNWTYVNSLDDLSPGELYKLIENHLIDVIRSRDTQSHNDHATSAYGDELSKISKSNVDNTKDVEFKNIIDNILNLFKPGSKERKYLVIKLVYNGYDIDDLSPEDAALYEEPEDSREVSITKLLGYNTNKTNEPASWKKAKYNMKDKIIDYLQKSGTDVEGLYQYFS